MPVRTVAILCLVGSRFLFCSGSSYSNPGESGESGEESLVG